MANFMTMAKSSMTNKCTSIIGHFDGLGGALGQYRQHPLMWQVQGYLRSHWMPPSGNYLLHITPVAARATGKQTTINKYTYFAGHFDGHIHAPVRYCAHCPMEEVRGFTRSPWTLLLGKYHVR
jgi:hypothetical protein